MTGGGSCRRQVPAATLRRVALLHVARRDDRRRHLSAPRGRLLTLLLMALAATAVLAGLAARRRQRPAVWHDAPTPQRPTAPEPSPGPQPPEPPAAAEAPVAEDPPATAEPHDLPGPDSLAEPAMPPAADPLPEADPVGDLEPRGDSESTVDLKSGPEPAPTAALALPAEPPSRTERVGFGARPVLRLPPQDAPTLDVVAPAAAVSPDVPSEDEGWGISVLQQCLIAAGILAVGLLVVFLLQLLLH